MLFTNFNDFKSNKEILDNERLSFEYELKARKIKKEKSNINLKLNYETIKKQIIDIIENEKDYKLTIGKKKQTTVDTSELKINIEFESDELGRIIIFKPLDNDELGIIDINGDVLLIDNKEIRDFYHYLTQKIQK
jgi:hypothetical protein